MMAAAVAVQVCGQTLVKHWPTLSVLCLLLLLCFLQDSAPRLPAPPWLVCTQSYGLTQLCMLLLLLLRFLQAGVSLRRESLGATLAGLQEMLVYGLKGMAAYTHHAGALCWLCVACVTCGCYIMWPVLHVSLHCSPEVSMLCMDHAVCVL
jgi:hypothetical protein